MVTIGENLTRLRKEKGLSLRKVAHKIGISHTNLLAYEKNETNPSIDNVLALCKFFNVSIEYLLFGEKAEFKYRDLELVELFCEVDNLNEEYRQMVKRYMRKILAHKREKEGLITDLE